MSFLRFGDMITTKIQTIGKLTWSRNSLRKPLKIKMKEYKNTMMPTLMLHFQTTILSRN